MLWTWWRAESGTAENQLYASVGGTRVESKLSFHGPDSHQRICHRRSPCIQPVGVIRHRLMPPLITCHTLMQTTPERTRMCCRRAHTRFLLSSNWRRRRPLFVVVIFFLLMVRKGSREWRRDWPFEINPTVIVGFGSWRRRRRRRIHLICTSWE